MTYRPIHSSCFFQQCFFLFFLLSIHLVSGFPASQNARVVEAEQPTCRIEAYDPFDYSVKIRHEDENLMICENPFHQLLARQKVEQDDYSCSETKPCSNGACCSKKSGYCGYGPDACGTNGQSPNDECWSNCDATAECGRFAKKPGQKCPLNVCCSQFGFCGMAKDFCKKTDNRNTTCQSNCDQPGSGASGGDVQKRIVGYYEAWVAKRACNGMSISEIPVNALTHLHFAFAYIIPDTFQVTTMDGVDESLLQEFTGVKSKNSGLKTIVSIGGWTFSDNGTATQPLFGEIVSSAAHRATFIKNLLDFMREYAFDGVDFDWEYPGAGDRGGNPNDGKNFVTFLKELRAAFDKEPVPYISSFTAPTSYWYLRNFDLSAVDHVDWVNLMSYDLHGVWDAQDPIGNIVLAHTNLTEIDLALDLLWRNKIPANKLNLGLGFYGRSFQLSDPSCSKPGCQFRGGASPGPCTDNSGTLAYFEIMDIISQKKLKPYYDRTAQAKYVVWDNDQWVSYDDEDTFKAKIDYANKKGLGGLLIWSIDQDTQKLDALKAVLGDKGLNAFKGKADDASYWQEPGAQDCYVTDCGGGCKTGFVPITHQPCGSAKAVTRHSSDKDSQICCPIAAAPNPKDCTWRGGAPSCNGHCNDGEVGVELNRWGNGDYCEDGNKVYCCKSEAVENTCYWTGVGGDCNNNDLPLTFAGTFLETIADIASLGGLFGAALADFLDGIDVDLRYLYCCSPDMMAQWQNCGWHGQPGSCFDNHCDIGHQVQLTSSNYGAGQSCAPRLERTRVFCCDPAKGKSPFLPVSLDYLFPNPPTGDNVDTQFDLKIDDTWGTGHDETNDHDDPDNASFGFWVLTSPEEIQVSLDKRDGSHWDLFNCHDAESESAQTVQMVCTDLSENSNCYKIGLGHGAPGTILGMPPGCGPAKYAVAVSMEVSKNQSIPRHLHKRLAGALPVVYDLTFDYDWMRVPRDLGDTQLRVDYSNEEGYWDSIVNKAASKKKKRSLEEMGGNHKRWLEEEWRDDVHFGALSTEELHKRWFGSDIITWLQGLLNVNIKSTYTHNYEDSVTAVILKDQWSCNPNKHTKLSASITAQATASIKVSSSFGMTIITTLGPNMDLSNSFLFLKTQGDISAIFTIDALAKADFESLEFAIATLPFPGASFSIPNLLTVGPKFVLNARARGTVQLAGHFETKVDIASWEFQQMYPDADGDFDPKSLSNPQRDFNLKGLEKPTWNASVKAQGELTAYLMPTLSFGIEFDSRWNIGKCTAELVATGYVRVRAEAGTDDTTCPFKYAVDAGALLTARATAPDTFNWNPQSYDFFPIDKNLIPGDGSNWACVGQSTSKREEIEGRDFYPLITAGEPSSVQKRGPTYGPFFHIPGLGELCPTVGASPGAQSCAEITGYDPDQLSDPNFNGDLKKRSVSNIYDVDGLADINETTADDYHHLEERGGTESYDFCVGEAKMVYRTPPYPEGTVYYDCQDWSDCDNFNFGNYGPDANKNYIAEHILERQMIIQFASRYLSGRQDPNGQFANYCKYIMHFWDGQKGYIKGHRAWDFVASAFPSNAANGAEMVRTEAEINQAKARGFKSGTAINDVDKMKVNLATEDAANRVVKALKDAILAVKYMNNPTINGIYYRQANRIQANLREAEQALQANWAASGTPYTIQGLDQMWATFMHDYTEEVIGKFEAYLNLWSGALAVWLPQQGEVLTPTRQTLANKIASLQKEVDAVTGSGLFTNPF